MTEAHKLFLDSNRLFVESYQQESPPLKMRLRDREELMAIVRTNFDIEYTTDIWCEPCVKSLVLNAYAMYDKYLKDEAGKH